MSKKPSLPETIGKAALDRRRIYRKRYKIKHRDLLNQKRRELRKKKRLLNPIKQKILKLKSKKIKSFEHKAKENFKRRIKYKTDHQYRQKCIDRVKKRSSNATIKPSIRFYKNEWRNKKISSDPIFQLKIALRRRIYMYFKNTGLKRTCSSSEILGCDFLTARLHIENLFLPGMDWKNHGDWHIDHIVPLSSAKNENDVRALCHYKNLQPLWAKDNLRKGAKNERN